jgi:hypothetical protein
MLHTILQQLTVTTFILDKTFKSPNTSNLNFNPEIQERSLPHHLPHSRDVRYSCKSFSLIQKVICFEYWYYPLKALCMGVKSIEWISTRLCTGGCSWQLLFESTIWECVALCKSLWPKPLKVESELWGHSTRLREGTWYVIAVAACVNVIRPWNLDCQFVWSLSICTSRGWLQKL